MPQTFLPQPVEAMYPKFQPDSRDLEGYRRNLVSKEHLSRMHQAIHSAELALHQFSDEDKLSLKIGFVKGLRESLNILETIATEIAARGNDPSET